MTAPKETCEGSGTSRKTGAGASEANRRGQFFFWRIFALLPDDDFLHAFFGLTLANSEFRHRDHLRLTWLAMRRHGVAAAEEVVTTGIRRFAQHNSHGPLYHDTMTRFWVRLVGHAVSARPEIVDFDEFLATFPLLLDKNTPLRHWSSEAMFAPEARAAWQDPNLVALPF